MCHMGFHRLGADAKPDRDLRLPNTVDATEYEDFPAARWQRRDCRIDRCMEFRFRECTIGIGTVIIGQKLERDGQPRFSACCNAIVSHHIQRTIARGMEQPRLRRDVWVQSGTTSPERQHRILHHFLRTPAVANESRCEADQRRIPGREDDIERRFLACTQPREEVVIGGRTGDRRWRELSHARGVSVRPAVTPRHRSRGR